MNFALKDVIGIVIPLVAIAAMWGELKQSNDAQTTQIQELAEVSAEERRNLNNSIEAIVQRLTDLKIQSVRDDFERQALNEKVAAAGVTASIVAEIATQAGEVKAANEVIRDIQVRQWPIIRNNTHNIDLLAKALRKMGGHVELRNLEED